MCVDVQLVASVIQPLIKRVAKRCLIIPTAVVYVTTVRVCSYGVGA
jgi:hypothetical protein